MSDYFYARNTLTGEVSIYKQYILPRRNYTGAELLSWNITICRWRFNKLSTKSNLEPGAGFIIDVRGATIALKMHLMHARRRPTRQSE